MIAVVKQEYFSLLYIFGKLFQFHIQHVFLLMPALLESKIPFSTEGRTNSKQVTGTYAT